MNPVGHVPRFLLVVLVSALVSFHVHAQTGTPFHGCDAVGDAKPTTLSDPELNLLKNREIDPGQFESVHFDDFSGTDVPNGVSKAHRSKWPSDTLNTVKSEEAKSVQVLGYILAVKLEGPESPNCHSNDQADRDFHIWLANSADDDKWDGVVVEITPRIRAKHPNWTTKNINKLKKDKNQVRISGWVLLDPEHASEVGKSRATVWEIHPILKIEVLKGTTWTDF